MFLLIGMNQRQKQLEFVQTVLCPACGRYGRYQVFMTCNVFTLFFLPIARWNRRYYVQTTCCQKRYELNPEVGRRIESGEQVTITPGDLRDIPPMGGSGSYRGNVRQCRYCGYTTTEDFAYCPKCGKPF